MTVAVPFFFPSPKVCSHIKQLPERWAIGGVRQGRQVAETDMQCWYSRIPSELAGVSGAFVVHGAF